MNILRAGDKSPVQRGFFKNSVGDLQPRPQSNFKKIALARHDCAGNFYLI